MIIEKSQIEIDVIDKVIELLKKEPLDIEIFSPDDFVNSMAYGNLFRKEGYKVIADFRNSDKQDKNVISVEWVHRDYIKKNGSVVGWNNSKIKLYMSKEYKSSEHHIITISDYKFDGYKTDFFSIGIYDAEPEYKILIDLVKNRLDNCPKVLKKKQIDKDSQLAARNRNIFERVVGILGI